MPGSLGYLIMTLKLIMVMVTSDSAATVPFLSFRIFMSVIYIASFRLAIEFGRGYCIAISADLTAGWSRFLTQSGNSSRGTATSESLSPL
jgi:hypothetical protein